MAKLNERVQQMLDEARILVLVAQVLLGFEFHSVLQDGFDTLPLTSQYFKVTSLALMLIAIALLLLPASYHHVVARERDTFDFEWLTTHVMEWALLPFAVGLGLDLYVVGEKVLGLAGGLLLGSGIGLVALFMWYGLAGLRYTEVSEDRSHGPASRTSEQEQDMTDKEVDSPGDTPKLQVQITQTLTEARMVLPGVQALLGFQFIAVLGQGFDKLPSTSQYIHLTSLAFIALSAILLMTPAAYHRLVEKGQDSQDFLRLASRLVVLSMVPLALGISGDFFVVVRKVTHSTGAGIALSALMLALFFGLWFAYTFYRRSREAAGPVHGMQA